MFIDTSYDVIVIGGGLMGAAAAATLSQKGKRVLLLEAYDEHHELGSSHGQSRVSRELGFEATVLPHMARDTLRAMRQEFGMSVKPIPTLFVTEQDSPAYRQLVRFAREQQVDVGMLSASQIKAQYHFSIPKAWASIVDQQSFIFNPYELLDKLYAKIERNGGVVRFNTAVTAWESHSDKVCIRTKKGSLKARQLLIAAGAWTPEVLHCGRGVSKKIVDRLSSVMITERTPVFYFKCPKDMPDYLLLEFAPNGSAVADGGSAEGILELWGIMETLPDGTKSLKVGFYYGNKIVASPERTERIVSELEKTQATAYVQKFFGQKVRLAHTTTCLNARATDKDVALAGGLPGTSNIFLLSHTGYSARYALALGDALSAMMLGTALPYDMSAFSPAKRMAS